MKTITPYRGWQTSGGNFYVDEAQAKAEQAKINIADALQHAFGHLDETWEMCSFQMLGAAMHDLGYEITLNTAQVKEGP